MNRETAQETLLRHVRLSRHACVVAACAAVFLLPTAPADAEFSDIPYADVDQTSFAANSPQATQFLSNPVAARNAAALAWNGEVTLPPLPDALKPLGPARVAATSIIAELPSAHGPNEVASAARPPATREGDLPEASDVVMETPKPKRDTNAFLEWVRTHRDAEDLARQQRDQYTSGDAKKGKDDGAEGDSDDLLLHLRQPYLWGQEAPATRSGSSVIYTVPQR